MPTGFFPPRSPPIAQRPSLAAKAQSVRVSGVLAEVHDCRAALARSGPSRCGIGVFFFFGACFVHGSGRILSPSSPHPCVRRPIKPPGSRGQAARGFPCLLPFIEAVHSLGCIIIQSGISGNGDSEGQRRRWEEM